MLYIVLAAINVTRIGEKNNQFQTFLDALNYYYIALKSFTDDSEKAYLDLVTAVELAATLIKFDKKELHDEDTRQALEIVASSINDGPRLSKVLESKVRGIKKQFTKLLCRYPKSPAFHITDNDGERLSEERLEKSIRRTYDLRSKRVHSGLHFSRYSRFPHNIRDVGIDYSEGFFPDKSPIYTESLSFFGLEKLANIALYGTFLETFLGIRVEDTQMYEN